jgi:leader peptidase (prepilin peptidase)/N-methyltransferase
MTPSHVLAVFAFVFGAVVGSFLNVCIYRLPRDLSVNEPRRSFCPHCNKTIPWYQNLPIISWLWLRGQCGSCGARISPRYLAVEILTGGVFLALWLKFGLPLAPAYALFAALLIVATFIDFEHYIIPDEVTIGGAVAGIVSSTVLPGLMGASVWWQGALFSLGAAALGYGALWLVVEGGKLAFGRKRLVPEKPEPFRFEPDEENPRLIIGGEVWPWQEIFSRPSDAVVIELKEGRLNGSPIREKSVRIFYDRIVADEKVSPIEDLKTFTGVLVAIVIPREAMGFGDVKFLACIGAFLGWQAIVFTIAMSSIIGALIGGLMLLFTQGKAGGKIPFGPYLALGAALWLICGPDLVGWYLHILRPAVP